MAKITVKADLILKQEGLDCEDSIKFTFDYERDLYARDSDDCRYEILNEDPRDLPEYKCIALYYSAEEQIWFNYIEQRNYDN